MNYEIEKQYDPELDCCTLLSFRYGTRPPQSMLEFFLQEIADNRRIPVERLREVVLPALELEQHIASGLKEFENDMDFFFPSRENSDGEAGFSYWQLRRRGICFASLPRADYLKERAWLLSAVSEIPLEKMEAISTLEELITVIESSDRKANTLRVCLRLWKDPAYYQDRFNRMLDEAIRLYRERMDLLPSPEACTFQTFNLRMQRKDYSLKSFVESQRGAGPLRFVISPFFLMTNVVILNGMTHPDIGLIVACGLWDDQIVEELRAYDNFTADMALELNALGDQKRLEILSLLREGPQTTESLCSKVSLSPALLSYHMNQLCRISAAIIERSGRSNIYSLNTAHLRILVERMTQYFHLNEEEQE